MNKQQELNCAFMKFWLVVWLLLVVGTAAAVASNWNGMIR
jgi:hypothetical protein